MTKSTPALKISKKEERNLKILKYSVIAMGVLLVLGTFALFIAVVVKSKTQSKVFYSSVQTKNPVICNYKTTEVPVSEGIVSATTNDNILTILTKPALRPNPVNAEVEGSSLKLTAPKRSLSQQVIVYDLCSGEVLRRVDLVSHR